jgi:glutamine synthetase type III
MTHELRVQAVSQVTDRTPLPAKVPQRLEALWATDVFTLSKMQASLPKDVYKSVKNTTKWLLVSLNWHHFFRPSMDKLREYADGLEGEVADDFWPLPRF